jgi:hypothetical protein
MEEYTVPLQALFTRTWDVKKVPLLKAIGNRAQLPDRFSQAFEGELHLI